MKRYLTIAGEGLGLILVPVLALLVGAMYLAVFPFFLLGLLKRGVVAAITGGDPLVP
jgi:hypothetical protein